MSIKYLNGIIMGRVACLMLIFLQAFQMLNAQDSLILTRESINKFIGSDQYYLIDTTGSLKPDQLPLHNFNQAQNSIINLEFQKHPVWIYIPLKNELEIESFFLDIGYPLLDSIEIYVRNNGYWKKSYSSGLAFSYEDRPVEHQHFIFPFDLESGRKGSLLIRIRAESPIQVPIKIFSEESVIDELGTWDFGKGLFYGIMMVMFLYNSFVLLVTRDRAYLYYVLFVLFMAMTQTVLDGTFQKYIYAAGPETIKHLLILFPAFAGVTALQFARIFMHVKDHSKPLNLAISVSQLLYVMAMVLSLAGFYYMAFRNIDVAGLLAALLGFGISLYLSLKGQRAARLFLLAWSLFLGSLVIYVLQNVGVIEHTAFPENILQIGISTEVVLLSLALADRINTLRKEKQESQAEALRISQENERIIRDQNVVLEQRVKERTVELEEANEELSVTLSNLRETQTQLVDAEKMASLGQLTAGIAHEINNPINFVTSNIKPLDRDLQDMYEIIDAYIEVDGENLQEKLVRAHQLREELDYDFIREEIQDLIKGISDGAHRTSEIVKGLRTFSRLDEDAIKQADLHEGITSTLVLLRSKIKERVKLVEDFDPAVTDVECFPGKLNQIFMNILNNAIYAVEHKNYPEGEEPTISIKTRKEGTNVKIHFIDNGIGMDDNTLKKIYDPFFTTKDVGEGTGLGMSIVYKIIEKHRGKLDVQSELGAGSEFIITLPVSQPNEFE